MLDRLTIPTAVAVLFLQSALANAQTLAGPTNPEDTRQWVQMPPAAVAMMGTDMRDHLAALDEIIGLLAAGDLDQAADVAQKRLGTGSMGKHRGSGMAPGRFMPPEMRRLGWSMHSAATDFADVARTGEARDAYVALQGVTRFCVACHAAYRVR